MRKNILKGGLLCAILLSGIIAVSSASQTVENFLPSVNIVRPVKSEYSKTISGVGIISHENAQWLARIAVNEAYIRFIEVGQSARLSGAAFDAGLYTATVSEVSENARQQNTGLSIETVVDVTLTISTSEARALRAGYTVRASISIGEPQEVLIIPYNTISQDDDGEYVYLLKNRKSIRQNIITGAELEHGVQVIEGISESDELILNPESVKENALLSPQE